MEVIYSIDNFEDGGTTRDINSPRTLEACLRCGLDPAELASKSRSAFVSSEFTKQMVDAKYANFERKRQEKIALVRSERTSIVKYSDRKKRRPDSPDRESTPIVEISNETAEQKASAMLEMEEKRMEALRRRQEKELNKIIEKEQALALLQQKILRAEEEERRKKKVHDKKVADQKATEEKRLIQRAQELKRQEEEEAARKRELGKKEAEFEAKMKIARDLEEKRILQESKAADRQRQQALEEYRRKTDELIKSQMDMAEQNRLTMIEREQRVQDQLVKKQEEKQQEIQSRRERATKRIDEALEKHHEIYETKKQQFNARQADAERRARENLRLEHETLKKQADDREKRNKARVSRLVEAYRIRTDHREAIIERRNEKDQIFGSILAKKNEDIEIAKFNSSLKFEDKQENVERVARVNDFNKFQTLKRIEDEDLRYETIMAQKQNMMSKHREEAKQSLIRKHEISEAMALMRITNDFSLLDKLFAKKSKKDKGKQLGKTGGVVAAGEEADAGALADNDRQIHTA